MSWHRLNQMRAKAMAAWAPPPRIPLSDWIEANMFLPSGLSAVPGLICLWKFQRELADALIDPAYERVSVIKGARLGYSTLLVASIAYYIRIDPSNILAVLPTDDDSRSFVVSQIEPVFATSPLLQGAINQPSPGTSSFDTLRHRRFSGGSLRVISARAPRNLRAHSARVLIVDEADACEMTAEGSPILLAEKRTLSFDNRKILIGSTPTNTTTSEVHAAYESSDQRVFEVPCPDCHQFNEIRWKDIQWPEGKPEEAAYCCPTCGVLHPDSAKAGMVAKGRWRITAPHVKGHAGFRINCLVAPHGPASWPRLAAEFLQAKRNPDTLRTFVNTILGEPWSDDADDGLRPHELQTLAEPISLENIPAETLFLASGCDIQTGDGGRIEVCTIGFTDADAEWLFLDHKILYGDPLRDDVWHDLDELIAEQYDHPAGGKISRSAVCVDAGDGNVYKRVLAWCAGQRGNRIVVPIKGAPGNRPPLTHAALKRARGLHICGVDSIKTRLFDRLSRQTGIRFSDALPPEWYSQLLSERAVIRYTRGQPRRVFERFPGHRGDVLDAAVYAIAARTLINTATPRREAELAGKPPPAPMPTVIRSAWLAHPIPDAAKRGASIGVC